MWEVGSPLCAFSTGRAKAARLSDHTLTQTETLAKPQTTPSRNRVITIKGAVLPSSSECTAGWGERGLEPNGPSTGREARWAVCSIHSAD